MPKLTVLIDGREKFLLGYHPVVRTIEVRQEARKKLFLPGKTSPRTFRVVWEDPNRQDPEVSSGEHD